MKNRFNEILNSFDNHVDKVVVLNGRIISVRRMKNFTFATFLNKNHTLQLLFNDQDKILSGDLVSIRGRCFYTKKGEPTVEVKEIITISRWKSKIGYKSLISGKKLNPLAAFSRNSYIKHFIPYRIRNLMREYFNNVSFLEVQTPVLGEKYNGGRSYPVTSKYLNKVIGYNRSTFEEKMQALIGSGFDRIFQIGSVFRSSNEHTFVEGYAVDMDINEGQDMIRELIQFVAFKIKEEINVDNNLIINSLSKNEWNVINYFNGIKKVYGNDVANMLTKEDVLIDFLLRNKIINENRISLESLADIMADKIVINQKIPTIITNFPMWSSPLYEPYTDNSIFKSIQRTKMYFPGQGGGLEIGIQENNYERFLKRVDKQQKHWLLPKNDVRLKDSCLSSVMSGGLPKMFGFGLNPDRISRIIRSDSNIDPFK